jgi:uncharacterized protein (TIGR02453 family)
MVQVSKPGTTRSFSPELFAFLRELRENNDRDWFKANKQRYEEAVQEPALEFVAEFAPLLESLSPHFVADPRPVGGSLFRIYRDTRFSKDKTPYKTHTGISFRHELAKNIHAPVFYLHLDPGHVFAGAGIWHPDTTTLAQIRDAIVRDPERWQEVAHDGAVGDGFRLGGDSLKKPPAGFDAGHPLIDDLKRKDYIASTSIPERKVSSAGFAAELAASWATTTTFVRFLCDAIGAPF